MTTQLDLSIVIPVHNEQGAIAQLVNEIEKELFGMRWELICVDDGSIDRTLDVLREIAGRLPQLQVLHLDRQYGQSAALWRGLKATRGRIIVTLDGDGQNDPANIPILLAELDSADFVIGWRRERNDPWSKRIFSCLANYLRRLFTRSKIPDSGCSLRAFRREVISDIIPLRSLHRFLPTMLEMAGKRIRFVPVNHRSRSSGRSKYGFLDRLAAPIFDFILLQCIAIRRLPPELKS
jgi:dolichol-phosphate mannosyltransferase